MQCRGKFRQRSRQVINCPAGTSSSQEVEENRDQKTIMNNCYNISGVSYITLRGIGDLSDATILYDILQNGGNTYRKTWNMNSAEVKFDTPVDIYAVQTTLKTFAKSADVYIDFYTASNVLIRTLSQSVAKAADTPYQAFEEVNAHGRNVIRYTLVITTRLVKRRANL